MIVYFLWTAVFVSFLTAFAVVAIWKADVDLAPVFTFAFVLAFFAWLIVSSNIVCSVTELAGQTQSQGEQQ